MEGGPHDSRHDGHDAVQRLPPWREDVKGDAKGKGNHFGLRSSPYGRDAASPPAFLAFAPTPVRNAYRPVRSAARVGEHVGFA